MLNSRNHPSKLTATIPANAAASEDHPLPQLPSFLPPTTTSRTSPRRLEQNPTQTPRNQRTPSWTKMRKTSPSNLIRILRSAHSPPLDSSCWSQRLMITGNGTEGLQLLSGKYKEKSLKLD
ncbi:hypothetical protein YC2023_066449 [Brassica napus]